MKNPPSKLEKYKSYIGKEVLINGKKHKVTSTRKSGNMILAYYEFDNIGSPNKLGVINAEIIKEIK